MTFRRRPTLFNEKNKELHQLVKDHVVGGASLIFHRYYEKGVTKLRQNEYGEAARPCRSIVGYDANALYFCLSWKTCLLDGTCFVKVVELWECEWKEMRRDPAVKNCLDAASPRRRHARWTKTSQQILSGMRARTVFGLIECDICVPEALLAHFAEMQPAFKNIRRDHLGPFILGSYRGDKILLATPLLRWYLVVTHVYQVTESSDPVLQAVRRCSVHGLARGRRPPTQGHHRGHHEVAEELELREDHHQCGPTS